MPNISLLRVYLRNLITEGRVEDAAKRYPNVPVSELSAFDPSGSNKYLLWMAREVDRGADQKVVTSLVKQFHTLLPQLKTKDIYQFSSLDELRAALRAARESFSTDAPIVHEDETHFMIRLDSKRACIKWGDGTSWCITQASKSHYENYVGANVVFYYIVRKVPKGNVFDKIALSVERDLNNKVRKAEIWSSDDKKLKSLPRDVSKEFMTLAKSDAPNKPKGLLAKMRSGKRGVDYADEEVVKYYLSLPDFHSRLIFFESIKDEGLKEKLNDAAPLTATVKNESGTVEWYVNGKLHRDDDKPAAEDADGTKKWYVNGKLHRDGDKPAIEWANGTKHWYINEKLHRDGDKPAIEFADGMKMWWVNGKRHRDGDKPAIEFADGRKEWYVNGKLHRDGDKPAIEFADGSKEWYVNGKLHREDDKPAIEYANGHKEWWVNGKRVK